MSEITAGRVAEDLRRLGLDSGDTLMVHSSLRSLASSEARAASPDGGQRVLLEGLALVLGSEGLLAVPTFSGPVPPGPDVGIDEAWHPDRTPSRVGQFTNYVLAREGRARSDHPTHSVAAVGRGADAFCQGHSWRDDASPFDRRGPWGKLAERDGRILWLGTKMNSHSAIHAVEDWMGLPYLGLTRTTVDAGGGVRTADVPRWPTGHRDFYTRSGSKVDRLWQARADLFSRGKVCDADCALMGARVFMRWLWERIDENPTLLLCERPECDFCREARPATEAHVRSGGSGDWRSVLQG